MPVRARASRPLALAAAPPWLDKRDPVVAGVIRRWRELTTLPRSRRAGAGEPLLVACSGGADSSALVLMLAAATDKGIVAHIVHDLRPKREALADCDAAKRLAARVGWRFVQASIKVRALAGNAEANARRVRYEALATLARRCGVGFIATGHQGDDQIETVLMRLMRGSGPTRLAGIRARRVLPGLPRVEVIRPMLTVSAADARRVCRGAGWQWQEDRTNADVRLLRNRLRVEVVPRLRKMRPDLAERVGVLAAQSEALDKMFGRAAGGGGGG
ncbi:MAG: tRNA lysidine(34) synthetase TilS, partial [Phycisphaerales bacterium]